jgi:hypothetical protein
MTTMPRSFRLEYPRAVAYALLYLGVPVAAVLSVVTGAAGVFVLATARDTPDVISQLIGGAICVATAFAAAYSAVRLMKTRCALFATYEIDESGIRILRTDAAPTLVRWPDIHTLRLRAFWSELELRASTYSDPIALSAGGLSSLPRFSRGRVFWDVSAFVKAKVSCPITKHLL